MLAGLCQTAGMSPASTAEAGEGPPALLELTKEAYPELAGNVRYVLGLPDTSLEAQTTMAPTRLSRWPKLSQTGSGSATSIEKK